MPKGDGRESEWRIPQPGDEGYPWDSGSIDVKSMLHYMNRLGIRGWADEGWGIVRARVATEIAANEARSDVRLTRQEAEQERVEAVQRRDLVLARMKDLAPEQDSRAIAEVFDGLPSESQTVIGIGMVALRTGGTGSDSLEHKAWVSFRDRWVLPDV